MSSQEPTRRPVSAPRGPNSHHQGRRMLPRALWGKRSAGGHRCRRSGPRRISPVFLAENSPVFVRCCATLLPHEGLKFLRSNFAILVGIHSVENPFMNCRHLLEGERSIAVRVGNGEHDLHHVSARTHHRHSAHSIHHAGPHHTAHHVLTHHSVAHCSWLHHPRLGGRSA